MESDDAHLYSCFYGHSSDVTTPEFAAAPWPRPLAMDLSNETALEPLSTGAGSGDLPITSVFSPASVKKWISVSWCPNSFVAAACHADAIHIIEGMDESAAVEGGGGSTRICGDESV